MARSVATFYGLGIIPCGFLATNFIGFSLHTLGEQGFGGLKSILWDLGLISFSCIPMLAFLLLAIRLEWKIRGSVNGIVAALMVLSVFLLGPVVLTAHADALNWWFGLSQILTCAVGTAVCVFVLRKLSTSQIPSKSV